MSTQERGLGSSNMDDKTKHDIQSKGGKASHSGSGSSQKSGNVIRNHAGGGALSKDAQRKGGQSSHRGN
jgi:general stress protein YciG